ncbi:MAG: hypothetical protein R2713_14925 [Ilumatobacteraceae bacterium]
MAFDSPATRRSPDRRAPVDLAIEAEQIYAHRPVGAQDSIDAAIAGSADHVRP